MFRNVIAQRFVRRRERKDLQTFLLRVFTHAPRLFRRLKVFQPHDLACRAARTPSAYRDFGPDVLFGTVGGKDLQTLPMRVFILSPVGQTPHLSPGTWGGLLPDVLVARSCWLCRKNFLRFPRFLPWYAPVYLDPAVGTSSSPSRTSLWIVFFQLIPLLRSSLSSL